MSSTIVETPSHGTLPTNRADDLDDAFMDGGPVPLWPLLQQLIDRSGFSIFANANRLLGSGDFSVDAGGTSSTFAVNTPGILAAPLYDAASGVYVPLLTGPATIGASKIEGGGVLANTSWYYVYVWSNAGAVDYEISLTPPSSSRIHKAGSGAALARVYLGAFPTDSSGAPIPLFASKGRYAYDVGGVAAATLSVIATGADATYTLKSCAAIVPPHARLARIFTTLLANLTPANGAGVSFQRYGSSAAAAHTVYAGRVAVEPSSAEFEMVLDASQRLQYKVLGGANAPTIDASIYGFCE